MLSLLIGFAVEVSTQTNAHPNILLITIDTLRADRLGCYGYKGAQTPNIDRLAQGGMRFTDAVSHVPLTRPSHTSIFTGLYPFQHGVHDNIAPALDKKIPTLAEVLKKNGYTTAAFVSSFVVNSQSGLNRGFDVYEDEFNPQKQPTQFALNLEKRGGDVYQEFSEWMSRPKNNAYFAWVHLYDPHFPYAPPPPYDTRFANRPYDGEVAYADEIVGKLLKKIDANTLVVLVSDHGESLGDHGENAHSYFIYDSTLRVPMIFYWPGTLPAGQTVSGQTRLIDLFPTILDLISIAAPKGLSGISLKPWLLNPSSPAPILISYCETYTPLLHFGWSSLIGTRTTGWKYISAPRSELYDLSADPGEAKNILSGQAEKAKELKAWLAQSGALQTTSAAAKQPELDPEQLEKLASLGYAGVPEQKTAPGQALADPKDKIEDFKVFNQLIREGIEAYQQEHYREAVTKFEQLKAKNIPSFEVYYYLGRSLLRSGAYDNSRTDLERALAILPHFLPAYRDLSEAYEGLGKPAEAEASLKRGLVIAPNHPLLVQSIAWLYQRQKRFDEAERLLTAELAEHPEDLESRFRLSAIYRDSNHPDEAIAQLKLIVKSSPSDPEAHNQLGMLYGGNGRLEEALSEFREAARLSPKDQDIRHNLELIQSKMSEAKSTPQSSDSQTTISFRIIQAQSRAAAESLLRKLQAGASWDTLSKDYSIHPSSHAADPVITLPIAEIDPTFRDALGKLAAGKFSPVIESSGRFYILLRL